MSLEANDYVDETTCDEGSNDEYKNAFLSNVKPLLKRLFDFTSPLYDLLLAYLMNHTSVLIIAPYVDFFCWAKPASFVFECS